MPHLALLLIIMRQNRIGCAKANQERVCLGIHRIIPCHARLNPRLPSAVSIRTGGVQLRGGGLAFLGGGWSASQFHQVEDCHQELWSEPATVCTSSQLLLAKLSASLSPGKMVFETALQTEDERS